MVRSISRRETFPPATNEPPMTTTATNRWRTIAMQAPIAGLVAGTTLVGYLALTSLPDHNPMNFFAWIPSVALGAAAGTTTAWAILGILLHYVVSIGWAGGYAYLTTDRTFLNRRWLISGLFFGLMVYMFMDLLLIGVSKFTWPPTPLAWLNGIFAVMVFFGAPLALVISRLDKNAAA